jgi:hypothetical protein
MSQVITARLARSDAQPWGFRLQGGKDFGTPLVIQKVSNFLTGLKRSSVQHSRHVMTVFAEIYRRSPSK